MLTEWRHDRVLADFETALAWAKWKYWPPCTPSWIALGVDQLAEVVYWSITYGRVMYRSEFGPPDDSSDLDLVVVARSWAGLYVAVVARTGPEGWAGSCVPAATVCEHREDAIEVGLDEQARVSLGFSGWYR